jgi:lipoprotein-anchoring transpeptidase ErfK/SrfK
MSDTYAASPTRARGGSRATPLPRGCTRHTRACFSVSRQLAWLISPSGAILRTVPALGGRPGHETPRGRFRVIRKDKDHYSSLYTAPGSQRRAAMPHYVQFAPAIGFHQGSLGVLSHGCVHLRADDARAFFAHLKIGDEVVVTS